MIFFQAVYQRVPQNPKIVPLKIMTSSKKVICRVVPD